MHATLTFRQERFVFEYLKDQNASAAAARAGYSASNLASAGSELMKNPAIRDRVRLELQNLLAEAHCSVMDLLKERMRAAHFRVAKVIAPGWQLRPLEEIDEETRAALEMSMVLRKGVPEVRLKQPDRCQALRALERLHDKLERLERQEYRRMEKAGELPTLEEIDAAEAAAVAEEARRLAAESAEKPQEMSGWHVVAPVDGEGGDSIYAKNDSSLLSARSTPVAAESGIDEKGQDLSGCDAAGPVGGEGADSIFAKNNSCLLSPGAMPVASKLQTVKKDQDLSGWHVVAPVDGEGGDSIYAKNDSCLLSPRAMPVASRLQTVKKHQDLSGSGGNRRPRLSPLVAAMLAGLGGEGGAPVGLRSR